VLKCVSEPDRLCEVEYNWKEDEVHRDRDKLCGKWLSLGMEEGIRMNTEEIRRMSRIERLQAMEALWDSLIDKESKNNIP